MKHKTVYAVVLFLVFLCVHDSWAKRPLAVMISKGDARVTLIEGTAEVMPAGKKVWCPLVVDSLLVNGDQVKTGPQSRIEMILPDESRLRFADNTRFRIVNIEKGEEAQERNVRVNVVLGRTWANVSKTLGVQSSFELSSENAVAGVRGTVYRMNVYEDKSALVRVYDGKVAVSGGEMVPGEEGVATVYTKPHKVEGPKPVPGPRKVTMEEWVYIIKSMQQIKIRADGVAEKPREFTAEEDKNDWVDWNKGRDAVSLRY